MKAQFTIQQVRWLQKEGKIRGFTMPHQEKGSSAGGKRVAKHFKKKSSALDWLGLNLLTWCNEHALHLQEEYRFDEKRMWRFDWCIESLKVAVEFEGGIFQANSGHKTAKHYTKDTEKYNRAAQLGWRVLRYTALNYKNVINDLNEIIK